MASATKQAAESVVVASQSQPERRAGGSVLAMSGTVWVAASAMGLLQSACGIAR